MSSNKKRMSAAKDTKGTVKRLLGYLSAYKLRFIFVVICIAVSAATVAYSAVFIQDLIDDYITPLLTQSQVDFTGLKQYLIKVAVILFAGAIAAYLYNRFMVVIGQGILKKIRDEMFSHMQKLPIRYFDTHAHGDIMSHYTNDTDTLRQMISQSIPAAVELCYDNRGRIYFHAEYQFLADADRGCFCFYHSESNRFCGWPKRKILYQAAGFSG